MNIITVIFLATLLAITFYDFKFMAVPALLLILTIVLATLRIFLINPVRIAITYFLTNICGAVLLLVLSILLLYLLKRKIFNPVNKSIGIGDLIFLPVICVSFSPLNFLVFMILSLGLILSIKPFFPRFTNEFPLAGGLSLFCSILLITGLISGFNLYDDALLIKLLLS